MVTDVSRFARSPFSRWREKVPEADEGGATEGTFA